MFKVRDVVFGEGQPRICIPLVAKTLDELIVEAKFACTIPCDVIEWRIDHFEDVCDHTKLREACAVLKEHIDQKVLLITFRSFQEGGVLDISNESYFEIYKELMISSSSFDLLDVELFMPEEMVNDLVILAKNRNIGVVMCNHDFHATPEGHEIVSRLTMMHEKGADICKIAVMPQSAQDVLTLLQATLDMQTAYPEQSLITMSMGGLGSISRLSGEIFGSCMTFGVGTTASAPGQIPSTLLDECLGLIHKGL